MREWTPGPWGNPRGVGRYGVPYRIVTVTGSHRTGFGLQVEPAVSIKALAGRVADTDVPVRGDTLLLLFPEGRHGRAILADFALEAWRDGDTYYSRSSPDDPEFVLVIGTERGPEDLPPGTEIWLDDAAPTGGARSGGWSRIIAQFEKLPWVRVDADADPEALPSPWPPSEPPENPMP